MAIIHLNHLQLAAGDVIPVGNFGRLLRELHHGVNINGRVFVLGMVAREYIFELARRELRPSAPSRLTCAFACPTEEDARLYAVENNKDNKMRFYEVEPTDGSASTHKAAISHCTMVSDVGFIDLMEPKAKLYWQGNPGDPTKGWELLFASPLRVIRPL
jgi:Protein of unknown function (DUF2441)